MTMSSINCSRNDVVLLPIPFTDLTSRKVRPAVVIGRNGMDLFMVPISSRISNTDFPLREWRSAGLNVLLRSQSATCNGGGKVGSEGCRCSHEGRPGGPRRAAPDLAGAWGRHCEGIKLPLKTTVWASSFQSCGFPGK